MTFSTRLAVLGTLALALATTGCGTVAFKPAVQSVGEYKNTQAVTTAAEDMDPHVADDVKVLVETLPDGMALKDGQILIDHDRYEMLGKVSATCMKERVRNLVVRLDDAELAMAHRLSEAQDEPVARLVRK